MPGEQEAARRAALVPLLAREGLDALLVTHPPNLRYLSGFTGSAGLLLVRPEGSALVTDFRYATQAPDEARGVDVHVERSSLWERLGRLLAQDPVDTLGIEASVLSVRDAERVSGLTRARVSPTTDLVERLRVAKAPAEVASVREAANLAQEALAAILPTVAAGQTELEVAAALEAALRRRGSEWHPFQTIVASGPRARGRPSRRAGRRRRPRCARGLRGRAAR